MLKKILAKTFSKDSDEEPKLTKGYSSAELAAKLLIAPTALMPLSVREARLIVRYMKPQMIAPNTVFIRQGDQRDTGFMLLLLEGEVTVENIMVSRDDPIVINVLGPGSLIGELSLLDGGPRYASCTAATPVHCIVMTREALQQLMTDEPTIAAKLILAMASRIADRLRENTDKLKMYVQLTQAMQQELSARTPY
ncbi:MAG: cyclic nucleotide-binding domain-containing protein [Polaromonas sp.]|nr:cyclic nucleotide-binding domain-containing protein [Polaromonas sp.]